MTSIPARTDHGTGLVLPLAKAMGHLLTIHIGASTAELGASWPMTTEEAAGAVAEAQAHLAGMNVPRNLLTEEVADEIDNWISELAPLHTSLRDADGTVLVSESEHLAGLRTTVSQAWTLLTHIDRELTGLSDAQTDPGRLP